jgi:epoxyqueuosine reductase
MVCPHNTHTPQQNIVLGEPQLPQCLDLTRLFQLTEDEFKKEFKGSPLLRAKRVGLLRNAAVVLGNQGYQPALLVLNKALQQETDPAVEDACRWAIQQIEKTH